MAEYVVQENDGTSKFTLEDGTGAILLEAQGAAAITRIDDGWLRAIRRRQRGFMYMIGHFIKRAIRGRRG